MFATASLRSSRPLKKRLWVSRSGQAPQGVEADHWKPWRVSPPEKPLVGYGGNRPMDAVKASACASCAEQEEGMMRNRSERKRERFLSRKLGAGAWADQRAPYTNAWNFDGGRSAIGPGPASGLCVEHDEQPVTRGHERGWLRGSEPPQEPHAIVILILRWSGQSCPGTTLSRCRPGIRRARTEC